METTRNIAVKARFTVSKFIPFRDKCAAMRISQSAMLFDLAIAWSEQALIVPAPVIQAPGQWEGIDKAKSIRPIVVFDRAKPGLERAHSARPQQPRGANPHRSALF